MTIEHFDTKLALGKFEFEATLFACDVQGMRVIDRLEDFFAT